MESSFTVQYVVNMSEVYVINFVIALLILLNMGQYYFRDDRNFESVTGRVHFKGYAPISFSH